jgi:hypothetical protein
LPFPAHAAKLVAAITATNTIAIFFMVTPLPHPLR